MIGPYFFENDDDTTVTVNSQRYCHIITEFFSPAIEVNDLKNMWFQQDSATCHTTRTNMALLQETFLGHVLYECLWFKSQLRRLDQNEILKNILSATYSL